MKSHDLCTFDDLVERFSTEADVEVPGGKRPGFGSATLRCGGKIFAMCPDGEALVVKLPAKRVAELVEAKLALPYIVGVKTMKEWVSLPATSSDTWGARTEEALAHARSVSGSQIRSRR